jgi:hypothetical protein
VFAIVKAEIADDLVEMFDVAYLFVSGRLALISMLEIVV